MGKYINPFTDFGFKKLFGEEVNKGLLISFLNDILPIDNKIVDLSFKKNEQQGDLAITRKAVYDIFCEDEIKQYEESLKIYRDNINVINTAKKEGYNEGIEKGIDIGEDRKVLKVAINLLKMGLSIEQVAEGSELTTQKVQELKNKIFKHCK